MGGMAYMCKNRHGTYYARFIIPKQLQLHFKNKKEIRRSLQTDSRKLAIKRARVYRVEFESIVDQIMSEADNTKERARRIPDSLKGEISAYQVKLEGETVANLPNGEKKTITGKIERNLASLDEDTTPHKKFLLNQLREEARCEEERAERQAREKRADELHQAQLAAIAAQTPVSTQPAPQTTSKKASEYIDEYITHKMTSGKKGSWSEGTARQKPNKLNVFRDVFGDKPAAALTREDMEHYIKIAYAIPANFGNPHHEKKFKRITLDMIINNAPEFEAIDCKERSAGTVKEDLKNIEAFLNWVSTRKDIDLKKPINGLKNEISDIDYESKRRAFTDEELKILFVDDNPAPENYVKGFSEPINFFLPLIGLYTGARLAEICQLHLSDIKPVKALSSDSEHWCIDINDNDDKKLKTKDSKRQIPIHKNLIDAGLLAYVDNMRAKGETKLFPNAARTSDHFGLQSKWFGLYSDKAGVTDKKTAFHSFRHTFTGYLNNKLQTPEDLVIALTGHQYKSLAKSTYDRNRKRDVGKLAEVIGSIDYGLTHPKW